VPNKDQQASSTATSAPQEETIRVSVVGNPNSGKTTLFNALTGASEHVGNYPGVTTEESEALCEYGGKKLLICDLPGNYSLASYSFEDMIVRRHLIRRRPNVVVLTVDATNLERHLYLAIQVIELGVPVVLALTMVDNAKQEGYSLNIKLLEELLGVPVVAFSPGRSANRVELLEKLLATESSERSSEETAVERVTSRLIFPLRHVNYGVPFEKLILAIEKLLLKKNISYFGSSLRWLAIKLIEGEEKILQNLVENAESQRDVTDVLVQSARARKELENLYKDSIASTIAQRRYGHISGACQEVVRNPGLERRSETKQIDAVVLNRFLGLPIFLGAMYLIFQMTFTFCAPVSDAINWVMGHFATWIGSFWEVGSESMVRSLLVEGVVPGVGNVLVFLPNILLLFFAITVLEESGYMARAAFLMDRMMHKMGLHGKSFIPIVLGFGCTVPAVMATRAIENERDRRLTMLVLPLFSCSSRLLIFTLLTPAFFVESWRGFVLWSVYLMGIFLAFVGAWILRKTLFRGESPPFVMELPLYRVPAWKSIFMQLRSRTLAYLKAAGTITLILSVVLWALQTYPSREKSLLGQAGKAVAVPLSPCGFDERAATAMIGAMAAKEMFVSQMAITYSLEGEETNKASLQENLRRDYTPLQAYAIMLFCLIATPCIATLAIVYYESRSWWMPVLQFALLTLFGWVIAALIFQVGMLF